MESEVKVQAKASKEKEVKVQSPKRGLRTSSRKSKERGLKHELTLYPERKPKCRLRPERIFKKL